MDKGFTEPTSTSAASDAPPLVAEPPQGVQDGLGSWPQDVMNDTHEVPVADMEPVQQEETNNKDSETNDVDTDPERPETTEEDPVESMRLDYLLFWHGFLQWEKDLRMHVIHRFRPKPRVGYLAERLTNCSRNSTVILLMPLSHFNNCSTSVGYTW